MARRFQSRRAKSVAERGNKPGAQNRSQHRPAHSGAPYRRRKPDGAKQSHSVPAIGQQITAEIGSLTLDGEAVVRHGQYVLFVSGAIPGEKAVIEVISAGPRYGRARALRIVHPSPARVEPRCRHFGECGGCSWQHINYGEQIRWKERLLRTTLEHAVAEQHLAIQPMICMDDPWGTRNKVHFLVGGSGSTMELGHYRAHSRDFVPVVECPVHQPIGNRVAREVLRALGSKELSGSARIQEGVVRHVLVRVAGSGDASQVTVVASRAKFPGASALGDHMIGCEPTVKGVHLNVNSQPGSVVLGSHTKKIAGADWLTEDIAGVRFLISATSFFQTNASGAARLADVVLRYVPPITTGAILDLYAGVGLFSAPLSKRGHRVIAVEESATAVRDGIETLKHNQITGCRFVAGKVETTLKKLAYREPFQVVILDPPREGCPEWALRLIARKIRPERIIDVSCDPRSLGRDLATLTQSGYRVMEIQPIDMFPHTSHIESIALLIRSR